MFGYESPVHRPHSSEDSSAGPLVIRPSEETTPLMPGRRASKGGCKWVSCGLLALSASIFVIANLIMHFTYCPMYPSTMDAIRHEWKNETARHDLLRDKWQLEKQHHAAIVEEWKRQRKWHEKAVARRIQEEDERQERTRQEWKQESERHAREVEEFERAVAHRKREERERREGVRKQWDLDIEEHKKEVAHRMQEESERQEKVRKERAQEAEEHKKEVARRVQEESERQEKIRKEWAREVEKHRDEWKETERREHQHREHERQKWRREVEDHERVKKERSKREEEERQRLNMFWGNVVAHACTSYATREYTAQLMNLPATWEHRVEACNGTPLEIHGASYPPKTCEDRGPGVVIGRWEVNQHEPGCTTFWDSYDNKGCTSPGSGKRYITQKLENLPEKGDWKEFCATTPAHFDHMQFPGAQTCFTAVWGVFGRWEMDDSNC